MSVCRIKNLLPPLVQYAFSLLDLASLGNVTMAHRAFADWRRHAQLVRNVRERTRFADDGMSPFHDVMSPPHGKTSSRTRLPFRGIPCLLCSAFCGHGADLYTCSACAMCWSCAANSSRR